MAPASTSQISAQAVQEHFGKYYVVKPGTEEIVVVKDLRAQPKDSS